MVRYLRINAGVTIEHTKMCHTIAFMDDASLVKVDVALVIVKETLSPALSPLGRLNVCWMS